MRRQGLELAVASSSEGKELEKPLRVRGADEFIKASTSSDDVEDSKPDPDTVHATHDRLGHTPGAILLGDTAYDVEVSSIRVVTLPCGGWRDADLKGAIRPYDSPVDLFARFDRRHSPAFQLTV